MEDDGKDLALFVRFCYPLVRLFKEGNDDTEALFSNYLSTGEGEEEVHAALETFSFWHSYSFLSQYLHLPLFDKESITSFFLGNTLHLPPSQQKKFFGTPLPPSFSQGAPSLPPCFLSLVFLRFHTSKDFNHFDAERMSFGTVVKKLPHYLLVDTPTLENNSAFSFGKKDTKTLVYLPSLTIDEGDLVCFHYGFAVARITQEQETLLRSIYTQLFSFDKKN